MANRADYAWAPGDNVSEWKLDISTRDNAIRAAMALGPKGYRGNRVQIPEADLPAVKRKVAAALRKFGVPADSVVWQHVKASEDETTGDTGDTSNPVATPPPAFLSKLYERLKALWKGDQPITHEAFADAVKHARAHAGGKAKAANRQADEPIELADLCGTIQGKDTGIRLFVELPHRGATDDEPDETLHAMPAREVTR